MFTGLALGAQIEKRGFIFTLQDIYISVHNLDGDLMAILRILDDNGHRAVRTEEQFMVQVDYWLSENLP